MQSQKNSQIERPYIRIEYVFKTQRNKLSNNQKVIQRNIWLLISCKWKC